VAVWIDELGRHVERLHGCERRVFVAMLEARRHACLPREAGLRTQERIAALSTCIHARAARTIGDHQAEYVTLLGMLAATAARSGARSTPS